MKAILGFLCFVALSQGVGGLLYELTGGWFRLWTLTHRLHFLDGYRLYADIALIVLGLALAGVLESIKRRNAEGQ
jgi:hypothetical protein